MIVPPPILKGDELNQIKQLRSYLYQISQQLSNALIQVENGNVFVQPGSELAKTVASSSLKEINDAAANLKSMIIKNADIVRSEMDKIETELNSSYTAISDDYGEFKEKVNNQITATATDITSLMNYKAEISGVMETFSDYIVETSGFIKAGIVDYDGAIPILGIAIGQDIQTSGTQIVDGTEYDIITKNNMTVWTTEKLSFWTNGVEVAYFANDMLYVTSIKVLNVIDMGEDWEISFNNNGFSIDWIGDDT